jgi:hypothetical protein
MSGKHNAGLGAAAQTALIDKIAHVDYCGMTTTYLWMRTMHSAAVASAAVICRALCLRQVADNYTETQ